MFDSVLTVFGMAVFFGLLFYAQKAHTHRWRLLGAYANPASRRAKVEKSLATVVAFGGGWGFSHYFGVTIGIDDEGLLMRLFPPLSLFASPLFLPFDEMKVRPTDWFLNAESFAITMTRGNGVELIVDDGLLAWIRANSDRI